MRPYLESVYNVTLDRSSQEWIVGIVIALFLALALAGLNMAFRRWVKVKDETVPLVGLGLVAIFTGMVVAGMYVELSHKAAPGPAPGAAGPGVAGRGPGGPGGGGRGAGGGRMMTRMATLIFENADADHDGLLTIEEASNAAAKFVHDTDASGKGKLEQEALANAIRERLGPPGGATPGSGGTPAAPGVTPPAPGAAPKATEPAAQPPV